MHIPDGILSPAVCGASGVLAAGFVGYSLRKLQSTPNLKAVPLTAVLAGLVFAGQMVNFRLPLPGVPVSGHLIGGVLAAAIAGPWAGCLAMTLVLFVQLLVYADGGWLAFGANVLNMGVVGAIGGYGVFDLVRRRVNGSAGVLVATVIAAWVSVVAASTLFCIELLVSNPETLSGPAAVSSLFALMTTYHSVIGIGEAIISGLVLSYVVSVRPDLVHNPHASGTWTAGAGRMAWTGIVAALLIAAFAAPFASEAADGLEAAAEQLQFAPKEPSRPLLLDDYAVPLPGVNAAEGAWQKISVSVAGLLGTTVVLGIAFAFAWPLRRAASAVSDQPSAIKM